MNVDSENGGLGSLSPTQEHFLKKYILERRLINELESLNKPDCCELFGPPFKCTQTKESGHSIPLLNFFFHEFVEKFPFITNNSASVQLSFWQNTVQPFVQSFNSKHISDSEERSEVATKRKQVGSKLLSSLLVFYNSTIVTKKDLEYLNSEHLQGTSSGPLDRLSKGPSVKVRSPDIDAHGDLDDYKAMKFTNNVFVNIVAVRTPKLPPPGPASSEKSAWNFLPSISLSGGEATPRHHYEFVIQVVEEVKNDKDANPSYRSHFIARSYHDFQLLQSRLRKKYPGLMAAEIPKLPSKFKHDDGLVLEQEITRAAKRSETKSRLIDTSSQELASHHSNNSQSSLPKKKPFAREKLRLALRGYLRFILSHPEIVHSEVFRDFLYNKELSYESLSEEELEDYNNRVNHEKSILKTQYEYQRRTATAIYELAKSFEEFKAKLIQNPNTLSQLFHEVGTCESLADLSPLLRSFIEWSKLQVASTIYQVFLSVDNSSEWLSKCKKFHMFFPYSIMYGILKYTNPMKIVSRVMDLLLAELPTFSSPFSFLKKATSNDTPKHNSKNLLSLIFVMLLDEDLNDFKKELKEIKEEKLPKSSIYDIFIERIDGYVGETDERVVEEIKNRSRVQKQDLLLTILEDELIQPRLGKADLKTLSNIKQSHEFYDQLKDKKTLKEAELYFNLKQYWLIQLRKKDKELMKQLWQEPELIKLLRDFLTIFYQPLMKIFAKCKIHLVFKDFQIFMDDLMNELTLLNDGDVFILTPMEIFERSKAIFDKHEEALWQFIHNVYANDEDGIFLKFVAWIEKFLLCLRLKFSNTSMVSIDFEKIVPNDIDISELKKQLNNRIYYTLKKRAVVTTYLSRKKDDPEVMKSEQDRINKQWDTINTPLTDGIKMSEMGLNEGDMLDFDDLNFDFSKNEDGIDKDFQNELAIINEKLSDLDTSELDRFDAPVQSYLISLLSGISVADI
ncbi:Piso0_000021 [Millerozyma farinosa CBS 7064]|uniref:Piso0_000021 protein n=1 Tax=Pichia sorbitophila (strain ATCC MYA-4447 / BCRC 22081 / CBS 7064 / NBRC 10061 / NRRL Y-12695) TaxID=559304 RepID=G8YUB8_PICSO|nr:Piso0_000021 [Millerozyma farinosa CBS 7064]